MTASRQRAGGCHFSVALFRNVVIIKELIFVGFGEMSPSGGLSENIDLKGHHIGTSVISRAHKTLRGNQMA